MPRKLKELKEVTPKNTLENIQEDPAQNSVLDNVKKLYDVLGEYDTGNYAVKKTRETLDNILLAHRGELGEEIGDNQVAFHLHAAMHSVYLEKVQGAIKIEDEKKRNELKNLIEYVAEGLGIGYDFEISDEQKNNIAQKENADKAVVAGERAAEREARRMEVQGKSALNLLDENKAKINALPKSFRGKDAQAQEKAAREALEELCFDIMATRRSFNAKRNDKDGLSKASVDAEKKHELKQALKKNPVLDTYLKSMSYADLRKLAESGHGGAMEESFTKYLTNCDKMPENAPKEYMPTARARVEALQKKMDTTSFQHRTSPGDQRAVYIEMLATRSAVNSRRGDKTSLDVAVDPVVLQQEMEKFRREPLATALGLATVMGLKQEAACDAARRGHGGALEDILRRELRGMAVDSYRGYKLQPVDPRFAPTAFERLEDLNDLLKNGKLSPADKLRAAMERGLLEEKVNGGEGEKRLENIDELNRQAEEKTALYAKVLDNNGVNAFIQDSAKRGSYLAAQKIEHDYGGRLQAAKLGDEIEKALEKKPEENELRKLAAQKMVLLTEKKAFQEEQNDGKLFTATSQSAMETKVNQLMEKAEFSRMCDTLGPEKLAAQTKGSGEQLMVEFAKAMKKDEPVQAAENAPVKQEPNREVQAEGPQAGLGNI